MTAERRKPNPDRSKRTGLFTKLIPPGIFFLSAVLACVILFWNQPLGFERQEFVPGEPALRSFFSPLSFSFVDQKKTDASREEKVRSLPPVYRADPESAKRLLDRAERFFKAISEVREENQRTGETRWKELPFTASSKTLKTLIASSEFDRVRSQLTDVMRSYLAKGLLTQKEKRGLLDSGVTSVLFVSEDARQESVEKTENIPTVEQALEEIPSQLDPTLVQNKELRNAVLEVLGAALSGDVVFDEDRSLEIQKQTAESVAPVKIHIKKNELIIQRGMLVTEEAKERLDQVQKELATHKKRIQVVTGTTLVFLLYLLSFFSFSIFEPKIFKSNAKLLLFHAVILITLAVSKTVTVLPDVSIYLMPTVLAALLLSLLVSGRCGILGGSIMAVMSGFLTGYRADIMLATLLASLAVAFMAYRVRKRIHFFGIGLGIGFIYFLVITGSELAQDVPWRDAVQFGAFGFLNALLTGGLGFLLLPLFEMCFDSVTDVSLLELSDLNHPLIRKMMVEAPGTYHHSLIVSTLAESACEQIGAHPLLARVGCYFHDIGKIKKPEFFSENQGYLYQGQHDRLPPKISFEIIMDHVRHGIRLAGQYKLKRAIVDFIAEHQGTGVVYYFYKKAMDLAQPNEHIRADDFRYPGPKPQSKETAVVMLADSVEAASRSLKEPNPEAIQQLVRKIINDKFIDGQLDECELTLHDLHRIQASFVRNLIAIFHTRMKYPAMESPKAAPDIFGVNQFDKFRAGA